MLQRESDYRGTATLAATAQLAKAVEGARGQDAETHRAELIRLIKSADGLRPLVEEYGAW